MGVNENGNITEEDIINACDQSTKFLALTHMSNVTGQIIDIKKIKENISSDILIAVDGCQSIAHINIDVQDLVVTFILFLPINSMDLQVLVLCLEKKNY